MAKKNYTKYSNKEVKTEPVTDRRDSRGNACKDRRGNWVCQA